MCNVADAMLIYFDITSVSEPDPIRPDPLFFDPSDPDPDPLKNNSNYLEYFLCIFFCIIRRPQLCI